MPLYEYICDACGRRFELIRKFSDPPLEACPTCGGSVQKQVSSPAFQFKGSGFYITDYPKTGNTPGTKSEGSSGGGSEGKSENKAENKSEGKSEGGEKKTDSKAGKTETKSETKTESKSDTKSESKTASKP